MPREMASGAGYRIEKLNPLAVPKGKALVCELTGQPALYSVVTPHVTLHFATREAAKQAWEGILHKTSKQIADLTASQPLVGSEDERARRLAAVHDSKLELIDICIDEAARHVVQAHS